MTPYSKPQEITDSALKNERYGKGKVFTRRKMAVPEPVQAQESNSEPLIEVIISNPSLQDETEFNMDGDDQNALIAIRKGTRECTKRSVCPLAHFLSFKKFSPPIKPSL